MEPYAHANYSSPSEGLLDFSAQTATSTAVNTPASMAYTFRVGESSPRTTITLCSPSSTNDNDNDKTFCNDHVSASTPPTQPKPLYSPSDFVSLTDEDKTSVVHSLIHTPTFGLNELRRTSEGRASDYNDPFFVLGKFPDFKFNRIPEVLVIDHAHKRSVPMSFHHLHLLERSVVLQVVTEPGVRAQRFSWLGLSSHLHQSPWKEGFHQDSTLAISPSKMVQKRQQYFLDDDDDDDDEQPQDKRP